MSRQRIASKLRQIRRTFKRRHSSGMLYNNANELKYFYKRVTMFCVFVSDDETWLLRPHIFEAKKITRSPEDWAAWFAEHHTKIIEDSILDAISNRTGGKHWSLYRIIGFVPDARTKSKVPKLAKKRNQINKPRVKNGRSNIRRR